jgi:hypothetical protein
MRIDNANPNDAVNVHVEGRRGKPLGKIKLFGDGNYDADPKIPTRIVQKVLDELKVRGIEGRTPNFSNNAGTGTAATEGATSAEGAAGSKGGKGGSGGGGKGGRGPRGGKGGGSASNVFTFLAILSAILEAIHYQEEQDQGWYMNYQGEIVITNWARFIQNWNPHVYVTFKGYTFRLVDGKMIGVNCTDCELKQDASGELYIEWKAWLDPKFRKRDEEGKPSIGIQGPAPGRSG